MARPAKQGLDYFPFDVDFFEDEKIAAISGEFGVKGEITVVKLLCAIYRNGYFILWDEPLKYKLLRDLPGVSAELLDRIVYRLVKWGFFDEALFNSVKVLTSRGIQKRYFSITRRRGGLHEEAYLLVERGEGGVIDGNNGVFDDKNPGAAELLTSKTTQSKVNKRIKETTTPGGVVAKKDAAVAATNARKKDFHDSLVPYVATYGREMIRDFYAYWSELNRSGTKMRCELQPTWELGRRLSTWARREKEKSCAKREKDDEHLRTDVRAIGRPEKRSSTL